MTFVPRHRHLLLLLGVLCLITLVAAACGGDKQIGSKDLLDFDEQEARRLGETSPSPSPEAQQNNQPSPPPKEQPPPPAPAPAKEEFFDVALIASSPYFEPGNQLVMPRGLTLRVTNKDNTAERPTRTFTAEDGTFDSGQLKLGQTWNHKFTSGGTFRVIDKNAPFIYATLEVR